MKRILYSGGSFVTGDRIADALLDYAAALARRGTADRVQVPGLGSDDRIMHVDLVIGPASQLLAEHADSPLEDVGDEAFVAELRARAEHLEAG